MKWNDDWRTELRSKFYDVYIRLCECRNKRADILVIARLMQAYNPCKDKEDTLVRVLEWIGDWNGQYEVTDLTTEEYKNILSAL